MRLSKVRILDKGGCISRLMGGAGEVSERSSRGGMLGTEGGGTAIFLSCELNSGAWPSGAVVGRGPSPNVDFERLLDFVAVVVVELVLDTVLL
jgi:hypothetical protein